MRRHSNSIVRQIMCNVEQSDYHYLNTVIIEQGFFFLKKVSRFEEILKDYQKRDKI